MLHVGSVPPAATRALRQRVLRPHQTAEELAHPKETLRETGSFAATLDGEIVGTALVFPEVRGESAALRPWRLVALAVDPAHRRSGLATRLIERCIDHARGRGSDELWCHARTGAVRFYESAGFSATGAEWQEEHTGPHVLMWLPI